MALAEDRVTETGKRRVLLGRITSAHGIRGEVAVLTFTGEPGAIADYGPLEDAEGRRQIELQVVRVTDKGVVARIKGIADRTGAEALKGLELWIARDRLPQPDSGEFYHADLIGLVAVGEAGQRIGEVVAVQNYGAGDLIEIRLAGSRRTELLPFTDAFVPEVDLALRRIVVRMAIED